MAHGGIRVCDLACRPARRAAIPWSWRACAGGGEDAEIAFYAVVWGDEDADGDLEDCARYFLGRNPDAEGEAFAAKVAHYELTAAGLVRRPAIWRAVKRVAKALLRSRRRRLTHPQVMKVIGEPDFDEIYAAGTDRGDPFDLSVLAQPIPGCDLAADARAALKDAETVIDSLRAQLNRYEARLKKDEKAEQADKKALAELREALTADLNLTAQEWAGEAKEGKRARPGAGSSQGMCDPGYYAVGVKAWGSGARGGNGDLYQVEVVCQKLNVP
jgi:hypothetical protein